MSHGRRPPDPNAWRDWQSTRPDAGPALPAAERAAAVRAHQRAEQLNPQVTSDAVAVAARIDPQHSVEQPGLEHALKGRESYLQNVASDRERGLPLTEALAQKDLHRYTYTFPVDNYSDGVRDAYAKLEDGGFTRVPGTHWDWWDNNSYKGINTVWRHKATGELAEFQFHTPEGYAVKQENHAEYELDRSQSFADGVTRVTAGHRSALRRAEAERYRERGVTPPAGREHIPTDGNRRRPELKPSSPQEKAEAEDEVARIREKQAAGATERQRPGEVEPRQANGAGLHGARPSVPPVGELRRLTPERSSGGRRRDGPEDGIDREGRERG